MSLTVPTVTGYSAFWELTGDRLPYAPIGASQLGMRTPAERTIAKFLRRNQFRDVVAAAVALNGAAAGGTATSTYKRVQSPPGPSGATPAPMALGALGGNRDIETVTVINRATTSADETYIDQIWNGRLLSMNMQTVGYPTVAGSGGGGKIVAGVVGF